MEATCLSVRMMIVSALEVVHLKIGKMRPCGASKMKKRTWKAHRISLNRLFAEVI